jgi:hypothetical protein
MVYLASDEDKQYEFTAFFCFLMTILALSGIHKGAAKKTPLNQAYKSVLYTFGLEIFYAWGKH